MNEIFRAQKLVNHVYIYGTLRNLLVFAHVYSKQFIT